MTFDEVGAPVHLSGSPSTATNIPMVHTLLMKIQSTCNLFLFGGGGGGGVIDVNGISYVNI